MFVRAEMMFVNLEIEYKSDSLNIFHVLIDSIDIELGKYSFNKQL